MIRAEFIDGHWRVVDDYGCRFLLDVQANDGVTNGVFATRDFAGVSWDDGTRLDEHTALLLAGALRKLHKLQQENSTRIALTCTECNNRIRGRS